MAEHGEEVSKLDDLTEIKEKLAAIESLLQRLPEIQAAVFLKMKEEYEAARLEGKKSSDLWVIAPPNER